MQIQTRAELRALKKRAEKGDSEAQWEIGQYYSDGLLDKRGVRLVEKDLEIAVHWLRLSAEQGNDAAQNHLGVCLSNGEGVEKNETEALYWLKKALKNGDLCAANNIACIYRDRGNHRRAFFWYKRSAEQGNDDAHVNMGECYYEGKGVRKNCRAAVESYNKAIEGSGITPYSRERAMILLAVAYFEGKGVERSLEEAKDLIEEANIDNDHPGAGAILEKIEKAIRGK